MEIGFLPGCGILFIGIVGALLGLTGRVRYTQRAGSAIMILIFVGFFAIVSSLFALISHLLYP